MENINSRIISARKFLKISQSEAAKKSDLAQNALSRIESGKLQVQLRYLYFLVENGINANWLINGQGSMINTAENPQSIRLINGCTDAMENEIKNSISEFRKKIAGGD